MLYRLLGDSQYWQTWRPLHRSQWGRLLAITLLGTLWLLRRLLDPTYVFVGNDADLSQLWIYHFKFVRLWQSAGVTPWWNPFLLTGQPNDQGPAHPFTLLSLMQNLFQSQEKGLDHSLIALAVILSLTTTALLHHLRFSPLASLLGGLALVGTGTVATQLFAGHVAFYSALCLSSAVLLSSWWAQRGGPIFRVLPAAFCVAALFSTGSLQGIHLVLWLTTVFLVLRAALGSPEAIPAPTLWSRPHVEVREGGLLAEVAGKIRARECLWTLLRLLLITLLGAGLATFSWYPALAAGESQWTPTEDIFIHSAPPLAWLSLFIPHFFLGSGTNYSWVGWSHWEGQPGCGLGVLLLAIMALVLRRRRDLWLPAILLALGALLAAGRYSPLFKLYALVDPLVGHLEVPSRIYFVVNFSMILGAAWGLDSLCQRGWQLPALVSRVMVRVCLAGAGVWLVGYYFDGSQTLWVEFVRHLQTGYTYRPEAVNPGEYYVLTWTRYSAVWVLLCALTYTLIRVPTRVRAGLAAFLLLLDVTRMFHPYANLRPDTDFIPTLGLEAACREKNVSGKVNNLFNPLWRGGFTRLLYSEWNPGMAGLPLQQELLFRSAEKVLANPDRPGAPWEYPGPLNRLFGVEAYIIDKRMLEDPMVSPLFAGKSAVFADQENWRLWQDSNFRAPAYLARKRRVVADAHHMLQVLKKEPELAGESVVFWTPATDRLVARLTADRGNPSGELPASDSLKFLAKTPVFLDIECELTSPAVLVVNEAWAPDWVANVDGYDEACLPCQVDHNRGVLLGTGSHRVRFYYVPQSVGPGIRHSWLWMVMTVLGGFACWGLSQLYARWE